MLSSLILLACGGGGFLVGRKLRIGRRTGPRSDSGRTDGRLDRHRRGLAAKDAAGVTGYYLSESDTTPDLSAAGWVGVTSDADYTADVNLTLSDNRGVKTVRAWFRNAAGGISDATRDTVAWIPVPAPFAARSEHQLVVFNDRMYLIGGGDGVSLFQDVWSSADGAIWNEATNDFLIRPSLLRAVVFNDRIYVFENHSDNAGIYSSANGSDWSLVSLTGASPQARVDKEVSVLNDRIFVTGGFDNDPLSLFGDSWFSSDASNWDRTTDGGYGNRLNHKVAELEGTLYMTGGTSNLTDYSSDVHSSTDGRTWSDVTVDTAYPARGDHGMVAFNARRLPRFSSWQGETTEWWRSTAGFTSSEV